MQVPADDTSGLRIDSATSSIVPLFSAAAGIAHSPSQLWYDSCNKLPPAAMLAHSKINPGVDCELTMLVTQGCMFCVVWHLEGDVDLRQLSYCLTTVGYDPLSSDVGSRLLLLLRTSCTCY